MYDMGMLNSKSQTCNKDLHSLSHSPIAQRKSKVANVQNFLYLERLYFYHTSIGDSPLTALTKAINTEYFKSWEGLTLLSIKKLTQPDFTHFRHSCHVWKNIQSNK